MTFSDGVRRGRHGDPPDGHARRRQKVHPQPLADNAAIDAWMSRVVDYAEAMVRAEKTHLGAAPPKKSPQRKKKA